MELKIRELEDINIIENKDNISKIYFSDIEYFYYNDSYYAFTFFGGFNIKLKNLNTTNYVILRLYLDYNTYSSVTYTVKDYYSGNILTTYSTTGFENFVELIFKSESSKIAIDTNVANNFYKIYKIELINNIEYKSIFTDSDFNIDFNISDINSLDEIILPYSKTFKIYKTEFLKKNIYNPENKIFDVLIINNNIDLMKGYLEISEKVNEEYYNVNVSSYSNILKEILNFKFSNLLDSSLTYSISDFTNYLNNPDDYTEYKYYLDNKLRTDNFLNSIYKNDFTYINNKFIYNNSAFNFANYIRPGISFKYLLDFTHKMINYDYEIDDNISDKIDNLIFTYKEKENNEYIITKDNHYTPAVDDWIYHIEAHNIGDIIYEKDLIVNAHSYFKISDYISDFLIKDVKYSFQIYSSDSGDNINFDIKLELFANDGLNVKQLNMVKSTYKDYLLSMNMFEKFIMFPQINVNYHYAYTYTLRLTITLTNKYIPAGHTMNMVIKNTNEFSTEIVNSYKNIPREGMILKYNQLINKDITLSDFIKSFILLFNLNFYIDNINKKIYYNKNEFNVNSDNSNVLNLTYKYDILNKNIKYKDLYNNIILNFDNKNEHLYYDYNYITNVKNNNIKKYDIKFDIAYENFYYDSTYSEYVKYYNPNHLNTECPYTEQKTELFLCDKFDKYLNYGLGYTQVETFSRTYKFNNFLLKIYNTTKLPTLTSIKDNVGLWMNKNIFDSTTLYKWYNYPDYDDFKSNFDVYYKDYLDAVYKYNSEKLHISLYNLTNIELNKILKKYIIIIDNNKYFASKVTVSNNKYNLELIKIL